ncbi:MAG: hypothetical protein ABJH63_09790 [Rhizobiaceae bacterium]
MTKQENKSENTASQVNNKSPKNQRDERLKKLLRANLQRRKAKIRALKAVDQSSDKA